MAIIIGIVVNNIDILAMKHSPGSSTTQTIFEVSYLGRSDNPDFDLE